MSGPRNRFGVNDSADCHRTIGGVVYGSWGSCVPPTLIKAYRAAGVRCRRFGEELFIHPDDKKAALAVLAGFDLGAYTVPPAPPEDQALAASIAAIRKHPMETQA